MSDGDDPELMDVPDKARKKDLVTWRMLTLWKAGAHNIQQSKDNP